MTMSCNMPPEVLRYIEAVENDTPRACRHQHALAKLIRHVFETENIFVDEEKLHKYLGLAKYFPYEKLFPWEEFITALWLCTYKAPGLPRWKELFCLLGRGAGKDGFIAFTALCLVSPYNTVSHYNVDICANNEEQATTPVKDVVEALETPKHLTKLKKFFYHTKELVQGRKNKGVVKGRANNPKGRDGMRSGVVILNEIHAFENYDNIDVFKTGLGKVDEPRLGFFTSNGNVSEGPLDDKLETAEQILFEGALDNGMLPFICMLNSPEDVHDPENWHMANPSLLYKPALMQEISDEYREWLKHPAQNTSFMTKRMGWRTSIKDLSVTDYAKVKATNKPLPDLSRWSCIASLDYAEISDMASVNLHFKEGNYRYDISHSWLCLQSKTLDRIKAPWQDWADRGLLTPVDDVSINPDLIAAYIQEQAKIYNIKMLAMDHYRWTLVSESMRKIGFDANDKNRVKLVRPQDIMQVEPVIQECFDRGYLTWGDNPVLRWAVNNTKRVRSSKKLGADTGNFFYAKIEAKSRKTDPFMAFVAGMTCEKALGTGQPLTAPPIGAIKL